MTNDLRCNACQAAIDPASIDGERELATCSGCGRLVDLRKVRQATSEAPQAPKARARTPVELPAGMRIETGARLMIRRRWLRGKHWFLLALFAAAGLYLAYLWTTVEANAWLVIGTVFLLGNYYNLFTMFVNGTLVVADADGVRVSHGPLPSLFGHKTAVKKSDIEQIYSAKYGALFMVHAKLKSGRVNYVVPVVTAEQALFVEQELERAFGLVNFAVEGELGDGGLTLEGKRAPGAASGALLGLAIPGLIVGILVLFFALTSSEVSGRLQATGALGSWVFEPDDCSSGQREGFGGVVLTASAQPRRVVRVVRDPIRGSLIVVVSPGRPNHVLSADSCSRFEVNVERTNTSINEIWAMDGRLTLECGELSGSATFETCH